MRSKLKVIAAVLAVVVAGAAYKFVLAAPAETHGKVEGHVYVLPKEFLLNLADGRYAKLTVALVLDEAVEGGGHGAAPPEGFGALEQEPLVRGIVTEALTGATAAALASPAGRNAYKRRIRRTIGKTTDVEAKSVLFTDLVVQ
jgi:flagellar basal body-associated protein FliL